MKIKDILNELTLIEGAFNYKDIEKQNRKYIKSVIENIKNGKSIKLKNGDDITIVIDNVIETLDKMLSDDTADIVTYLKQKNVKFTIQGEEKNNKINWTNIEKTPFSIGEVKFNRGEVAEGILGAAITARFLNPTVENINIFNIENVLKSMTVDEKKASADLIHKSETSGKDLISVKISLKPPALKALFDTKKWPELKDEFNSAAKYANTKIVKDHANLLNTESTDDKVEILSIGSENEKGTKVDLRVLIGFNGENPKPTNLNLSLKTGQTKNLEQVGVSYEKISEALSHFGIDISKLNEPFVKHETWYKTAFNLVEAQLNTAFNKKNGEVDVIKNLEKAIKYFATKNEDITKVHLDKGDFNVFNYTGIEDKLKNIQLEAKSLDSSKRPQLCIRKVDNHKDVLITFRIEVRKGEKVSKLHIEGGLLLDDITKTSDY